MEATQVELLPGSFNHLPVLPYEIFSAKLQQQWNSVSYQVATKEQVTFPTLPY